jgi:hypothetical protein
MVDGLLQERDKAPHFVIVRARKEKLKDLERIFAYHLVLMDGSSTLFKAVVESSVCLSLCVPELDVGDKIVIRDYDMLGMINDEEGNERMIMFINGLELNFIKCDTREKNSKLLKICWDAINRVDNEKIIQFMMPNVNEAGLYALHMPCTKQQLHDGDHLVDVSLLDRWKDLL